MSLYRIVRIASLCAFVSACAKKGIPAPQGGSEVSPSKVNLKRNVELIRVEQRAIVSAVEIVGTIEAEAITQIPAGAAGIVDEVLFREGDAVDPLSSKPLVKIDVRRYAAELQIAEANQREAEAMVNAARDTKKRSIDGGAAITAEQRKIASEALAAAEAKLESAKGGVDVARNNRVRSMPLPPYPGFINQRHVTPGSYVKAETVIGTMTDLSRLRLQGYLPESATSVVRRAMNDRPYTVAARSAGALFAGTHPWSNLTAAYLVALGEIPSGYDPEFLVPAVPNRLFRSRLFYLSTTGDPATHMFEFKAEIDTRAVSWKELAPGYSAKIRIPVETSPEALVIPEEAVRATERGFIVFEPALRVNREGPSDWVARPRRVEIGVRSPGWAEIRQGLSPKQWIVRRGAEALEDGTPLRFPPEQQKRLDAGR